MTMTERCPHCSFDPTSSSDYCDVHRDGVVEIPVSVARLIRKVFLPLNPNKMRSAHPDTLAAVKAFIAAVEGKRNA
jgi:hypothetical protein